MSMGRRVCVDCELVPNIQRGRISPNFLKVLKTTAVKNFNFFSRKRMVISSFTILPQVGPSVPQQ